MDNFKAIYKILRYLEKAMDFDEPDLDFISAEALGISGQRWNAIMEMLAKEGYVAGVSMKRSAADDTAMLSLSNPRITLKGLEYLEENTDMKKAARIAKGIKETIPGL